MFEPAASCSADRRLLIDFYYIGNNEAETGSVLSRILLWNCSGTRSLLLLHIGCYVYLIIEKKWFKIRPLKLSHSAVRRNSYPVFLATPQ